MKKLLFLEKNQKVLNSINTFFNAHSDDYSVLAVSNGDDALDCIDSRHIDLAVVNLDPEQQNNLGVIKYLNQTYSDIPVLALATSYSPEIASKLDGMGVFKHLSNPLDPANLLISIKEEFQVKPRSIITGISIDSLLQLILLDQKTCTLKIKTPKSTGVLYCFEGRLMDALTPRLKGAEAAVEIISWNNTEVIMQEICRKTDNNINEPLELILLESAKKKDDREALENDITEEEFDEGHFNVEFLAEPPKSRVGEPVVAPSAEGHQTGSDTIRNLSALLAGSKGRALAEIRNAEIFGEEIRQGMIFSRDGAIHALKNFDDSFGRTIMQFAETTDVCSEMIDLTQPQCLSLNLHNGRQLHIILGRVLVAGLMTTKN